MLAFATSAVREAANGEEILRMIEAQTRVTIRVLPGTDESPADLPGRPALVRLVGRKAADARHRRRLAGDRGRS